MSDKIVLVEKNGHANLDSFPFRYGFSQSKDFNIFIIYSSKPFEQIRDNKKRLVVTNARFDNPTNKETLHGDFVLTSNGRIVVTVIRKDNRVEKTLSKALKVFRKYEYVQVSELIDYFHPLYINGDIKTHQDFKKYWIVKNSDNPEKIAEMESALNEAYKELDKEIAAHKKEKAAHKQTKEDLRKERKRADEEEKRADEWKRKKQMDLHKMYPEYHFHDEHPSQLPQSYSDHVRIEGNGRQ